VADLLDSHAALLEQVAGKVHAYAERARNGDAGDPAEGLGHHYLVAQSLHEILSAIPNMLWGRAFDAAASADRS